jgi:hypothetical protein
MLPGALLVLLLCTSAFGTTTASRVATPAPPGTAEELGAAVEQARLRFVAKDTVGVLAHLADNYRSGGLSKADVRQKLLALYSLYEALRARVHVDHVEMVDGDVWFYTTGEVTGRLPVVGWVTVLFWKREPEVVRRQGEEWHLRPGTATPFFGYGYQTWILPGERRMFSLRGIRGQAIYVDPRSKLVMVHTGVHKEFVDIPRLREMGSLWTGVVRQLGD